jgi:hypothetical protein
MKIKTGQLLILVGVAAIVMAAHRIPALAKAPPRSYTAAAGVVTDLRTKLQWQQLVTGQYLWDDAKVYCKSLALAGTGWRLPTIKELLTIADWRGGIDPVFLPTTDPQYSADSASGIYWSMTKTVDNGGGGWVISFPSGDVRSDGAPITHWVRCVR